MAEIEYPIGDKSRGMNPTEIEILDGDLVWLAFEAGDPRFPIITGWRNPRSANSVGWRRWHHPNVEINADTLLNAIAGSHITITSTGADVRINCVNAKVSASGDAEVVAGGQANVSSDGEATISATTINLNSK
ncbi:hypothetical protein [Cupriavidus basilensis]|uniref:hypothetical protein n=1 Tax=Cupriavidus basilensis TaxID=68895 RepID=UPI001186E47C|nr:hypothetical protein [Cupriavidus basilensis]